jgi:hypothetical protein
VVGALLGWCPPAWAQVPLYAQRLPEGTVYIRLVNALPGAASVQTDFAGPVTLGADGAARVSPYYVDVTGGGKTIPLQVATGGQSLTTSFTPASGTFVTIVLHPDGDHLSAALIEDKPEYNQLRARLAFYNTAVGCTDGTLTEASGATIFQGVAPDAMAARGINPVAAKVVAGCGGGQAPELDLGDLQAGGLYTVWMMRPAGKLVAFVAHDFIAPPRS